MEASDFTYLPLDREQIEFVDRQCAGAEKQDVVVCILPHEATSGSTATRRATRVGRLCRRAGQFGGGAAAGGQAAARLCELRQCTAPAVHCRLAVGEEGFPWHALRIGDPFLIGLRIAARRTCFLDDRSIGPAEPLINLRQLTLVFGLNAEMGNFGVAAVRADREIHPRVFKHPLGIVRFQHARPR